LDMRLTPQLPKRSKVFCGSAEALCGTLGTISLKGLKRGLKAVPNQDSWSVHRFEGGLFVLSLFDGHGPNGHEVSNRMRRFFSDSLLKQKPLTSQTCIKEVVETAFADMEAHAEAHCPGIDFSGTTATVVVYDAARGSLLAANVGDSAAVLGRRSPKPAQAQATQLTRDHDPADEEEQRRICCSGGEVRRDGVSRVYKKGTKTPGLNLSRSLGDVYAHRHCGVSAEPEVHQMATCAEEDQLLLVCSDGIWGVFTPEEAVAFVEPYAPYEAAEAASALAAEAWKRWSEGTQGAYVDDTTVLLLNLHAQKRCRLDTQSTVDSLPQMSVGSQSTKSTVSVGHAVQVGSRPSIHTASTEASWGSP